MTSTPATAAQIVYARKLIAERLATCDGQDEYLLTLWAGIHRTNILQGVTPCPAYKQARADRTAEESSLNPTGRLLRRGERPQYTSTSPDAVLQAAADRLAAEDLGQFKADLATDPGTLTAAQASALIDRLAHR